MSLAPRDPARVLDHAAPSLTATARKCCGHIAVAVRKSQGPRPPDRAASSSRGGGVAFPWPRRCIPRSRHRRRPWFPAPPHAPPTTRLLLSQRRRGNAATALLSPSQRARVRVPRPHGVLPSRRRRDSTAATSLSPFPGRRSHSRHAAVGRPCSSISQLQWQKLIKNEFKELFFTMQCTQNKINVIDFSHFNYSMFRLAPGARRKILRLATPQHAKPALSGKFSMPGCQNLLGQEGAKRGKKKKWQRVALSFCLSFLPVSNIAK